jgi:hypothetical protein
MHGEYRLHGVCTRFGIWKTAPVGSAVPVVPRRKGPIISNDILRTYRDVILDLIRVGQVIGVLNWRQALLFTPFYRLHA